MGSRKGNENCVSVLFYGCTTERDDNETMNQQTPFSEKCKKEKHIIEAKQADICNKNKNVNK